MDSTIRFTSFPRTSPPPAFVGSLLKAFRSAEDKIATEQLAKGLKSDEVLAHLRPPLQELGFEVETGKTQEQKVDRPVFFGENGEPTLRYEIDAYQPEWRCGLEVEAGRAVGGGNAIYRDLIQACVMDGVDTLAIAVSNAYKFRSNGRQTVNRDYEKTVSVADALYGHARIRLPFSLVVIGY